MKLLNDNTTLKILDKINNPFRKTSKASIKTIEESLYNLSSSCLSLSNILSFEKNVRKTRMENIKTIRSRGKSLQFLIPYTYKTDKTKLKIMSCIDEMSIFSNTDCDIFYWVSDEDEVFPLEDIASESECNNALRYKRFNKKKFIIIYDYFLNIYR